jgi:hypothetical protein
MARVSTLAPFGGSALKLFCACVLTLSVSSAFAQQGGGAHPAPPPQSPPSPPPNAPTSHVSISYRFPVGKQPLGPKRVDAAQLQQAGVFY